MTDYLTQQDPEDIRNVVRDILVRLAALEQGIISVNRLSELAGEAGDLLGARIISPTDPNIIEPTASDFSGWFLSAIMQALADGNFGLANVLNGKVRFGIGESGMRITGVEFLENHTATVGAIDRRARRGFQEIDSALAYLLEYMEDAVGSNLITSNPGFETGDLTGWTSSGGWAVSSATPLMTGSYYVTNGGTPVNTLTSSKYSGMTPGATYKVSARLRDAGGPFYAKWYTSADVLLRTDIVHQSSWVTAVVSANLVAPATAAKIELQIAGYGSCDDFSVELVTVYSAIRLDDDGVHALDAYKKVNLLGFPQSDLQFSTQCITSVTTALTVSSAFMWGFYRAPTAANANDGDEYLYQFVLDAGTYDLHIYGARSIYHGTVDLYLDGAAFNWGLDWYAFSTVQPYEAISYSVVIPTGGRHTIKIKVNGKNAASNDYIFGCTAIWFVPGSFVSGTYTAKV